MRRILFIPALAGALLMSANQPIHAQGLFGKLKNKAKQKVEQAAVDAISCAASDTQCIDQAKADGKPVKITDADGKPVSSTDSAAAVNHTAASGAAASSASAASAESTPPGAGAWLNYDFVPGDRVLFFDDFSEDHVGDLPSHLDIQNGNVTVVDLGGKKYLRTVTGGTALITLPEALPQRFTIEVTFHRSGGNGMGLYFHIGQGSDDQNLDLRCDSPGDASISGFGATKNQKESGEQAPGIGDNDLQTCRYMVDSGYVKAYVNNVRVGQLNGLVIARGKTITMDLANANDNGALITDLRIAEGGKPLYDALAAAGHVSTHGILFASGSATIEGESTPTLKEIGDMLKAHADLKLMIEGHTDNVGAAAANQTLSEQRAAAVKQFLVSTYGIDAARLQTKGYGSSKPISPNTTPEGRQNNRRVELVKL
ncbi:MAG TPA: OmpA family protein [Gemmatimonadaceae bacterium]|jgi:outer membrane protein OmpA-like peptidoglycan-associated protein